MKHTSLALAITSFSPCLIAADFYNITAITVNDSGNSNGNIQINANSSSVIVPDADLNLVNFTVDNIISYNAGDFISGVGTQNNITSSDVASVIQPTNIEVDNSLAYGTPSDLSGYLTQGERGLSFSSGLNYTTQDPVGVFSFDFKFNSDPTASLLPTFIVGDAADNQSTDLWSFLDENGDTLFSITLDSDDFTQFGKQKIDRIFSDDSGAREEDTDRAIALSAFTLTTDDLNGADWSKVRELAIQVPASGSQPKTDYAFFGVDTGLVESTGLVVSVPEPSSSSLLITSLTLFIIRRKRT